jgi:hypothetical protein
MIYKYKDGQDAENEGRAMSAIRARVAAGGKGWEPR